jgi:Holliday junction resolvasome RuvABC endonuclease subunit
MFLRFRAWLSRMLDMEVDLAVYEQSHFRGGAATEIGVNLTGRIQELCTDRGIEYSIIHTASLKKWACGHGKADKAQMVNRAAAYLGRAPIDDNEADAVLIGMMACEEYEA